MANERGRGEETDDVGYGLMSNANNGALSANKSMEKTSR